MKDVDRAESPLITTVLQHPLWRDGLQIAMEPVSNFLLLSLNALKKPCAFIGWVTCGGLLAAQPWWILQIIPNHLALFIVSYALASKSLVAIKTISLLTHCRLLYCWRARASDR